MLTRLFRNRFRFQRKQSRPSSEAKLKAILDNAIASIIQLRVFADRTWIYDYCSAGCEQVFGFTASEMMTGLWWSRIPSEDQQSVIVPALDSILAAQPTCIEYRFQHKDGSLRWISSHLSSQRDEANNCWVVVTVDTDISERKHAEAERNRTEEALRASEEKLQLTLYFNRIMTWEWLPDANKFCATSNVYQLIDNAEFSEIEYQQWRDQLHPEDVAQVEQAFFHAIATRTDYKVEHRVVWSDDSVHWLSAQGRGVYDENGQMTKMLGIAYDITERKRVEAASRESEEKFATIFRCSPSAIAISNFSDGRYTDVNETFQTYTGYTRDEVIGRTAAELNLWVNLHQREHLTQLVREQGKVEDFEFQIRRKTGEIRTILVSAERYELAGCIYFTTVGVDISDRKAAELALQQQAQREQALNQMIQAIRQSLDLDAIFAAAAFEVAQLLQADWVNVSQYLPNRRCWLVVACHRQNSDISDMTGLEIPDENNPLGTQLKRLEIVRVENVSTLEDDANQEIAHALPGAWLLVPVAVNGLIWGCLGVVKNRPTAWSDEHAELTQKVADQLAIAIQQAQLYKCLQNSEARLKDVLNNAITAFCSFRVFANRDWVYDYYSAGSQAVYGYSPEELTADKQLWMSRVHPEDRETVILPLYETIFHSANLSYEYRFYHKDGALRWHLATLTARRDQAADCWIATIVAIDITTRKQVEEELRENQTLYKSLADVLPLRLFRKDRSDRITFANQAFLSLIGITLEECLGKTTHEIVRPSDLAEKCLADDQQVLQTGEILDRVEIIETLGTNERCYIQTMKVPVRDANGQIVEVQGICWDITDRKRAEEALARELLRSKMLFNTSFDGIVVLDQAGNVIEANTSFAKMLGYSLEEMTTLKLVDFDAHWTQEELEQKINEDDLCSDRFETRHRRKDGSIYHVEISSNPVDWDEETVHFCICRDISDRKQAELELQQAREAAEAANLAKSTFLTTMSHELRTPLNAILGFSQLLTHDSSLNPTQQQQLGIINQSGEHLLNLISDVLEISKIEAGRVKLNENSFDLYQLLNSLEQMLRLKAANKHLTLTFNRASDVSQYITADESKLRQILLNLLSNAIKFTNTGSITLRVSERNTKREIGNQESTPASLFSPPCALHFEVEDTGCGIASEEMEDLFKAFVQTKAGQQTNEGTGLGLRISRHFVNLMGGDITVQSFVGQGSTFAFDIAVRRAEEMNISPSVETRRVITLAPNQRPYRILIVEDQWHNRQFLVELLTPIGFDICEARNGQEAISLWSGWNPHLILMDLHMPVMSGFEVIQQIRSVESSQTITLQQPTKIIALTADAFEETKTTVLMTGCDDFISKPIPEGLLIAKIAEHLGVLYIYASTENNRSEIERYEEIISSSSVYSYLSLMPETWIKQLHQAAVKGFDDQIFQLIEQIPEAHAPLVHTLTDWASNFRFDLITQLTDRLVS